MGEPELAHGLLPDGGTILELGCGAGRLTRPLAALGHPVVAVDESLEMLARIDGLAGVERVRARIERLALRRRFDLVLLASNLVNTPDEARRGAMLATCRRHLAPGGRLLVQWWRPAWFEEVGTWEATAGDVRIVQHKLRRDGDLLEVATEYHSGDRQWLHEYTGRRIDEEQLVAVLAAAGLAFEAWRSPDRAWFSAALRTPLTRPR
jgi:SAM-dependent methyltransferase